MRKKNGELGTLAEEEPAVKVSKSSLFTSRMSAPMTIREKGINNRSIKVHLKVSSKTYHALTFPKRTTKSISSKATSLTPSRALIFANSIKTDFKFLHPNLYIVYFRKENQIV